jgi:hypothetical protein
MSPLKMDKMDMKKYLYPVMINLGLIFLISGCSSLKSYGKLGLQYGHGKKVTIQELKENWQDYIVYYAGLSIENPSAIMFDPKEDKRKLEMHEWWVQVKDQEKLSELILWIQADIQFEPLIWRILGPDDKFYGFMYTAWTHVLIKVVDDNTMWVDDLSYPPYLYYNGDGERDAGQAQ